MRRRAEAHLRGPARRGARTTGGAATPADAPRLLHELQVHQVELEMQNAELRDSRDHADVLVEKYSDLYDFAPVGFLTLDDRGRILEANLTGAALLGVERSRLVSQPLSRFATTASRAVILNFIARILIGPAPQAVDSEMTRENGTPFWAALQGRSAPAGEGGGKTCRVAISDITAVVQARETQRRAELLAASNEQLSAEIVQRRAVEEALRRSEQHHRHLLEQVRSLTRKMLVTREDERKRISRELHDSLAQTLAAIHIHLEAILPMVSKDAGLARIQIRRLQRMAREAAMSVHQFALDLRPASLDDLGLIAAIRSLLKEFGRRTGIRLHFTAFAGADRLSGDRATALYRIVQSALANVEQHSGATRATVTFACRRNTVLLDITDDGRAFVVERVLHVRQTKRLGLVGMRERAEMLGGSFTIESAPGKGTALHVEIPCTGGARPRVTES